jgi:hypothetical protein
VVNRHYGGVVSSFNFFQGLTGRVCRLPGSGEGRGTTQHDKSGEDKTTKHHSRVVTCVRLCRAEMKGKGKENRIPPSPFLPHPPIFISVQCSAEQE